MSCTDCETRVCHFALTRHHVLTVEHVVVRYRARKVRIPLHIKRRLEKLEKKEADHAERLEEGQEPQADPQAPGALRELSQGVGDVSMDEVRDLIDALFDKRD